ncbi:MAG: DUF4097 family beta strand repeat protein [Acidobacteria bacterium]|nr:DUF4097 family beta strand repeat protein [Acidobacteriota bacterium]
MTIRWGMKIWWLVLALAVWWQVVGAQTTGSQDKEFHQTYDLAANGTVGIYNTSGVIRVSSWNENRVKVDAIKRGRNEADFARVQIEATTRPERVEIRVVYPNGFNWRGGGVTVDFDVKVPRSAAISPATSTSGDILVNGPVERVTARATSGNVSAQDVTDIASLNSTSGDIHATRIGGEVRANATSGTVIVNEANSRVFAQASSGSVRVTQARDDVTATVNSGDIRLEKVGGRAIVRSNSGGVVIDDVGGDVQATSFTEDITVANVRGRAVVNAISGNVILRGIAEGLKATAVSGSVNISDSKGRIEANTTSDNIILANLDSSEIVAKTTSGIVQFTGKLHQDGHYEFESFSGEVVLVLPPDSNFTLSAKTHSGSVNTEFPLQLTRTIGGSLMTGTVGKGGADVRASSFSGSVRIKKATR